jgi:type I restriction enzyme, R subunit
MAYLNECHIEEADIKFFLEKLNYDNHINAWKDELIGRDSLKEVVLKSNLKKALEKLNPDLPESCITFAIEELTKLRVSLGELEANEEIYNHIKNGIAVTFKNTLGKDESTYVKIIGFDDTDKIHNEFLVVSQLTIEYLSSNGKRRPDLILYINGLPLVMLELKNASIKIKTGYDDNLQTYRRDIPQLFYYNLCVGISNGIQTRLGSFNAPWEHFFSWAKLEDNISNKNQDGLLLIEQKSKKEDSRLSLQRLCEGLFCKEHFVDYLENFVLYHKKKIKIIAKNHQFLGVNRAIENFEKKDNDGKLGVFWHTQGSGKSYSMIYFSKKIRRKITGNWSFLIITDRNDLDDQIFKNFCDTKVINLGTGEKTDNNQYRAKGHKSRAQLEESLTQNKSYYFSTIFNFGLEKGKTYTQKSPRKDWIVIVDEAHRSQYKSLGENLKIALPNAQYIAFTGTPILKNGLTENWFGKYVSEYNFAQSIEDGATVPLFYRKSVPSVVLENDDLSDEALEIINQYDINEEQIDKLNKEYTTLFQAVKRDDRLDEIAKHIVKHFPDRLDVRDENNNRKPMKAMVISIDKFTAVRMFDKVQLALNEEKKELTRAKFRANAEEKIYIQRKLDFIEETKMAVVISQEGSDKEESEKFAKEGLDIKPHRDLINKLDDNGADIEDYFKDPNNSYRIVFVTAMWMTGFDAPSVSTLYLDKPMKNHTLMQTIARANRVYEGKKNGMIIDYFGVFRNLKKALSDYAEGSTGNENPIDMPVKEFGELLNLLNEAIEKSKEFLNNIEIDVNKIHDLGEKGFSEIELFKEFANIILKSDDIRKDFNLFVNTISSLYDSAKPEVYDYPHYKKDRDLLVYLKEIVNRKLDCDEEIEKARKDIDKLLDRSVFGNKDLEESKVTIADYKEINLGKLDFEKLRKEFPKKAYKNSEFTDLKEFMQLKLNQMMAQNKTRGKFLEDFQKVIDEYNNGSVDVEDAFEKLIEQYQKLDEEQERYIAEGFENDKELEIYDLLKKENLTIDEEKKVKKAAKSLLKTFSDKKRELFIYNWYQDRQKKEEVESTINEVLDKELPLSYDRVIFANKKQEVFNHIYHLAEIGDSSYSRTNEIDYSSDSLFVAQPEATYN